MPIPASDLAQINPGVVNGGGSALDLSGLVLTEDISIPIGTVESFSNPTDVGNWFGPTAPEANIANVYFAGYTNKTATPGALLFAQYPSAPVAGYLRGGSLSAVALAALQAMSGTLSVTVDGAVNTSSTIMLSAATSFSNAASIIAAGFTTPNFTVTYDSLRSAFTVTSKTAGAGAVVTGSITTTTLTVTAVTSGALAVGQEISGTGITAGTTITALVSGTGGIGTYTVSTSQTVTSTTITAAASSVGFASGTLAVSLKLDAADGAVTSAGANAGVPATNMQAITQITQNWASFMTTWEPTLATDKMAFSDWVNSTNNRYLYVGWDTDVQALVQNSATCWGALLAAGQSSGSAPVYKDALKAAFIMGTIASIDFTRLNGRLDPAHKGQAGLVADVTDQTTANTLRANGYNFYGEWATANDQFIGLDPGLVSGQYKWLDSYVNQIWLNNALQLAVMELLFTVNSIPYNTAGYALIDAACMDPITQALNFGAIRPGVPLSAAQAAEVNNAAGVAIDTVLSTRGWYLQILPATAQVRTARTSPPITFWYTDGGSVHKINIASIEVQ